MLDTSMLPLAPALAFRLIASLGSIAIQPPAPPGAAEPTVFCATGEVPVDAVKVIVAPMVGKSGCALPTVVSVVPPVPAVDARFQAVVTPASDVPEGPRALTLMVVIPN